MLRLEIDGAWEPEDFIEVLEGIESLYYKIVAPPHRWYGPEFYFVERLGPYLSFEDRLKNTNDWLLAEARMRAPGYDRITIRAIAYASPGSIDLLGAGKAMEVLDRMLGRLIDFLTGRKKRIEGDKQAVLDTALKEIQIEKERESLRAIQIQNARELLALRRDYHDAESEALIPLIVQDQDKLAQRIAEGKLISATRVEGEKKD